MGMILCLCAGIIQVPAPQWTSAPPLPVPITNNAVAASVSNGRTSVYSFLGLDSTKTWSGVTNRAFRWHTDEQVWTEIDPVPGPGRLASTAQAVGGRIFVFGGYTVAEDGAEKSLPDVAIWDPETESWSSGAPIPVPVDDAVSGIWRDSLVYLVSGWHDTDNVRNVQIYDPANDSWLQATEIPGTPVFGHSGAIAGDDIVYVDGAARNTGVPRYTLASESWHGAIDPQDPTSITWTRLPNHPGRLLYRSASVGMDNWVIMAGGTDNPYNYNGVGYDGAPSEPSSRVLGFNVETMTWQELQRLPEPSMDHRNIGYSGGGFYLVGGMGRAQRVLRRTMRGPIE